MVPFMAGGDIRG